MVLAELLGWFAAGLPCVISLPQVLRTVRSKQLDGISSATYWLVLANAAAWSVWSLLTGEYVAAVPAMVNGPAAIVILHRLVATSPHASSERHTPRRSDVDAKVDASTSIRFTDSPAESQRSGHRLGREIDLPGSPSSCSGSRWCQVCPPQRLPNRKSDISVWDQLPVLRSGTFSGPQAEPPSEYATKPSTLPAAPTQTSHVDLTPDESTSATTPSVLTRGH